MTDNDEVATRKMIDHLELIKKTLLAPPAADIVQALKYLDGGIRYLKDRQIANIVVPVDKTDPNDRFARATRDIAGG